MPRLRDAGDLIAPDDLDVCAGRPERESLGVGENSGDVVRALVWMSPAAQIQPLRLRIVRLVDVVAVRVRDHARFEQESIGMSGIPMWMIDIPHADSPALSETPPRRNWNR